MNGFRKWALAAYIVLSMYLLARPSSDELTERAHTLDLHLQNQGAAELTPALAVALSMPSDRVERHLKSPASRPSDLVFDKLLERPEVVHPGAARADADPAAAVIESGVSMNEALKYFNAVEKQVTEHLRHASPARAHASPLTAATLPSAVHGKPAR